jgi:hypothetical protein
MTPVETNPPAILTNAASVLALGTSNRFARNVDRMRTIIKLLEEMNENPKPDAALYRRQLTRYEARGGLLVRALSSLYFAIGCFAAGSLTSLLGAVLASSDHPSLLRPVLAVAMITGIAGLSGLIVGGALLVRETRLALATISEEAEFYRTHYAQPR